MTCAAIWSPIPAASPSRPWEKSSGSPVAKNVTAATTEATAIGRVSPIALK
jgi:hypothetical protein